ncbi:MAG: hypothetical protein E7Z83_10335 [Methanobrevibacter sp.]|nr:hypothetical protein [Methanobrevibacter sp.]MBE6491235.1 hypothetical protein [Methanobrevibacter sp.]
MNKIILICAAIFMFVIGVGCASAADLNVAGSDAPALNGELSDVDSSLSIENGNGFTSSIPSHDVQKVSLMKNYPDLKKEQNRPLVSFWDPVTHFDHLKNMTNLEE